MTTRADTIGRLWRQTPPPEAVIPAPTVTPEAVPSLLARLRAALR